MEQRPSTEVSICLGRNSWFSVNPKGLFLCLLKDLEKNLFLCHLFTTDLTWTTVGANLALCGGKLALNFHCYDGAATVCPKIHFNIIFPSIIFMYYFTRWSFQIFHPTFSMHFLSKTSYYKCRSSISESVPVNHVSLHVFT